uniref:Ig-like domain-containing protein n=1 Tax=Periophthalmus magnuspinnatus TaxID=409849 RepID=A0A3B3Z6B4_9GOBI
MCEPSAAKKHTPIFTKYRRKQIFYINLIISNIVDAVAVSEGEDAILPCFLNSRENIERFSWSKDHKEVFFYDTGRVKLNKQQRLTHFEHELKSGNASIKIRNTQKSDSGRYSCKVSDIQPSRVMLYVVGMSSYKHFSKVLLA